jgi:MFS family permease
MRKLPLMRLKQRYDPRVSTFSDIKSFVADSKGNWRRPEVLFILVAIANAFSFNTWQVLLNNFAIDELGFTGIEIGFLQSLREIPGFLSFAVVFLLLVVREQPLMLISLLALGVGTALTGFFPTVLGLYCLTVLMSLGYHYYEAVNQSLILQWIDKKKSPHFFGQLIAIGSFTALIVFGLIYFARTQLNADLKWMYLASGGITVLLAIFIYFQFPHYPQKREQNKNLVLRPQYWLFYCLTFMAGARRQIFMVFAGFMMVEKFGYRPEDIVLMFLANTALNIFVAPMIGKMIGEWGERRALIIEYVGLTFVFVAYAFVEVAWIAVALYIVDHLFFAMRIAIKTYFQKIANPKDIASSMGVSFTINHIASVVIPAIFGYIWIISPSAVFLAGAGLAIVSAILALLVPSIPTRDNVAVIGRFRTTPEPAE